MSKKTNEKITKATIVSAGILLIVVVGFFVILGNGLRNKHWHNETTIALTKVFPCRAAMVGKTPILFRDVQQDTQTLVHYYQVMIDQTGQGELPELEALQQSTLDRLIQNQIVLQEAERRGIDVSQNEIDKEIESLIEEAGSQEDVATRLEEIYNWSLEDFTTKVIVPYLYEQKLAEDFASDKSLKESAYAEAEEVLARINNGEDFAELASEYSDDTASAINGGELGWFGQGTMVTEFNDVVFALEVGQVSEIVETQFGYHIIKLNDKRELEGEPEVSASHILITPTSFSDWMVEAMESDEIIKYLDFEDKEASDDSVAESEK